MAKKTNQQNTAAEVKDVWVLTARTKGKDKQVKNFICKDGEATKQAVAELKEKGLTFVTLTTAARIRSYLAGNPVKEWKGNQAALTKKGIEIQGLYDAVLDTLDCTTEEERWAFGDVREVVTPDIIPEDL